MKILILGGTRFLGRALVDAALADGHELTLFNRGKSNPDLFPQVESIHGDRTMGLAPLAGRVWDAVIDTSGYVPRIVRTGAEQLKDQVGLYVFISSVSVYADFNQPGMDESAPLAKIEDESVEEVTGETYGPLKALCEKAVEQVMGERSLTIRPGLIVGPHDPTDRFSYWPYRLAEGGWVLAPGRPERVVQFIDVRDLAEWTVRMVQNEKHGVYNADGVLPAITMGELLESCRQASGSHALLEWVSEEFLLANEVGPWIEMPLWVPESDPEYDGFFQIDISKAVRDGLSFRPVMQTVQDTLNWLRTRPADYEWKAGLAREREQALLERWKEVSA